MVASALRSAGLALLLAIGCATAACDRQREGAIRVLVIGDEARLADPAAGPLTTPQAVLLANMAQGLVRFDARGHIVPGLAERWNVTDDGLSYIFRLGTAQWPDGERVTARQIARLLRSQIAANSRNRLADALGAVDEVVAMTDRVIEIRLTAPRPHLLQLLAQPEFALVRDGAGTGPFRPVDHPDSEGRLHLVRSVANEEAEEEAPEEQDEVVVGAAEAPAAVQQFLRGDVDLVLGGTFADLPYARTPDTPRDALRFDPVSGLFGLMPARADGPAADTEIRGLLSSAIDRQALVDAFDVPGLLPRATLLEPGLDGTPDPVAPEWTATPLAERRAALAEDARRLFAEADGQPTVSVALPEGPGAQLVLNRLAADWGAIGIRVERARPGRAADFRLIDSVAPSTSPAWFLRQFRCGEVAVCSEEANEMLDAARSAPVVAQRNVFLTEAARLMDEAQLFLPLAAPIRWSLVSDDVQGFAGNRFARHPLTALGDRLSRERRE
jgi:oligopeptide transport system substrate-binding protein